MPHRSAEFTATVSELLCVVTPSTGRVLIPWLRLFNLNYIPVPALSALSALYTAATNRGHRPVITHRLNDTGRWDYTRRHCLVITLMK